MSGKRPERRGKSPRRKRSGSSAAVKHTKLDLDDLFAPSGEVRRPKTVPLAVVELAASWAEALLRGKFDEAAQYLADDCTCVWDDECVKGPDGIVQRYREALTWTDVPEVSSELVATGRERDVEIHFKQTLRNGTDEFEFTWRDYIVVDARRITRIHHPSTHSQSIAVRPFLSRIPYWARVFGWRDEYGWHQEGEKA